jgi:ribose 5-phosphate isomerase B
MRIYLATDHGGFELKERIKTYLLNNGYDIEDCGAHSFDPDDDYPDYVRKAALAVAHDPENTRAIVFGRTGQGEAMCANRFKGVRAALYYGGSEELVTRSREHNNSNVLSLSGDFLTEDEAKRAVIFWLETPFGGDERHTRRIEQLDA